MTKPKRLLPGARKWDDVNCALPRGFRDWMVQDANDDEVEKWDDAPTYEQIYSAAKRGEKPVMISVVVHPPGTGVEYKSKRRTFLVDLQPHVWFYNGPGDDAEMMDNIKRGMPPKLVSLLYGIGEGTARARCKKHGFKLEGVR